MTCYDCERTFSRSSIEMHEVPVEHKDKSGYRFVPVPICHECALRRFGIKCEHCGEFHEDVEAVFECKRDRPGLIPDGGVEMTWDLDPCPKDGCDGELQHVSDYDVMCLECEEVFVHVTDESKHYLVDQDHTTAAEKEKLVADGGQEATEDARFRDREKALEAARQSGKTERKIVVCPQCGGEFQNLPHHLPCSGKEGSA